MTEEDPSRRRDNKRRKQNHIPVGSFLTKDDPEEIVKLVVSFCQIPSLFALRSTSRHLRRHANEEIQDRVLNDGGGGGGDSLLEANVGDGEYDATVKVGRGWSDKFSSRERVIQAALQYADPGGQVSEGSEYDEERATDLLRQRGWIDVEDFPARDEDASDQNSDDDYGYNDTHNHGGFGEVGWNVEIAFRAISSLSDARRAIHLMIARIDEADGNIDCSSVRLVALYFLIGAQPSSIRYAKIKYKYRHTDYPSGGEEAVLQFRTADDKEIELFCSSDYQVL